MVLMVGTVILTVIYISSITFLFARNVMETKQSFGGLILFNKVVSKFFLPGYWASLHHAYQSYGRVDYRVGSFDGGRCVRRGSCQFITERYQSWCYIEFSWFVIECTFGSQYIIGTLVAKSMTSFVGGFGGGDIVTSQTLHSLDVLVVQANTNVLSPP